MSFDHSDTDKILDELAERIRHSRLDGEEASAAGHRVWETLSRQHNELVPGAPLIQAEKIRSCQDLQSLIPAFLANTLARPRRLLLEDHLRECVPCRRTLRDARQKERRIAKPAPRMESSRWSKTFLGWAAAAVIVLGFALFQFGVLDPFLPAPTSARAVVELMEGSVFRVAAEGTAELQVGDELAEADEIRTTKDSTAILRLPDGTRVEVSERAQLSFSESRAGKSIDLKRGNIIVEAAEQRHGYLRVNTEDCRVSVQGTIFAVNRGTKGSRVSVIEGEVSVEQRSGAHTLRPGQQLTTHSSLTRVPVEREIAWSRNASRHLALLHELASLQKELEATLTPELHSSTALLDLMPEGTVAFVSIPNLSTNIREAYEIFLERLGTNLALQQWWIQNAAEVEPTIHEALDRLTSFGELLGDEAAIGFVSDETGGLSGPCILAEVTRPQEFELLLRQEMQQINAEAAPEKVLVLVEDLASFLPDSSFEGIYSHVHGMVFLATPSVTRLRQMVEILDSGTGSFMGSSFHSRIADAYEKGVGFLLAVDLRSLIESEVATSSDGPDLEALRNLGILDAEHLIAERRTNGDHVEMRAIVSFENTRTGLASWLAEPAPMGVMDFVSSDATAAAAFVVKDPVLLIEDLFTLISAADGEGLRALEDFEVERGISIRDDFAMPLGGEFLFALDGPILPEPAWKIVIEVYDAARLQQTIEWIVEEINIQGADHGLRLELLASSSGGQTFYSLVSANLDQEIHYVFVDGYMLVGPSKAGLVNALDFRATGYTLQSSPTFVSLLPVDGEANFSALFYQNLGSLLAPLAEQLPSSTAQLSEEDRGRVQEMLQSIEPTLMYSYAQPHQITLAGTGDSLGALNLAGVLGLTRELGLTSPMGRVKNGNH